MLYRQRKLGAPFKPYFGLSGIRSTRRTFLVIRSEAEGSAVVLCPSYLTAPNKSHRPPLCPPEELTCLWQVKAAMISTSFRCTFLSSRGADLPVAS